MTRRTASPPVPGRIPSPTIYLTPTRGSRKIPRHQDHGVPRLKCQSTSAAALSPPLRVRLSHNHICMHRHREKNCVCLVSEVSYLITYGYDAGGLEPKDARSRLPNLYSPFWERKKDGEGQSLLPAASASASASIFSPCATVTCICIGSRYKSCRATMLYMYMYMCITHTMG